MKLVTKIKLLLDEDQKRALLKTMFVFNDACNYISNVAFDKKIFKNFDLHKLVYKSIKEKFSLSSQFTCIALKNVFFAYKVGNKNKTRFFKKYSAVTYDDRILSWKENTVSLLSIDKRLKNIPFACSKEQKELLKTRVGQSDLIYNKGKFYLYVVYEAKEEDQLQIKNYFGVDLGIINIATTSDGIKYSGQQTDKIRNKYSKIKSALQSCGSKSAKRHLKKISGKQSKFVKDTNHCISRQIVNKAKALDFGIAMEELSKIKNPVKTAYNKSMKKTKDRHEKWSFYQLRNFIDYKAKLKGVPLILVNPKNTSRTCSKCGCIHENNRRSQSDFVCIQCGFSANADHNAAINIAARALVDMPIVAGGEAKASRLVTSLSL